MELPELKIRMKLPLTDTSQDAYLTIALEDAIDYAQTYCNQTFTDGFGILDIPPSVKKGIALIVKSMGESSNVASQSLGDMSKSFFKGGTLDESHRYFAKYKLVKFI